MMACVACRERGQTWAGDAPTCAFPEGVFEDRNWNCATVNAIRDICYEGKEGGLPSSVDYRYCDDQKYATICIDDLEIADDCPLALWVSWYKSRGGTDAMWFLFSDAPPRRPTENECALIAKHYGGGH